MKIITFIILIFVITGCKPGNNESKTLSIQQNDIKKIAIVTNSNILLIKDKEQTKVAKTNDTRKKLKPANYEKIKKYVAGLNAKKDTKKKLCEYAAFMNGKSPYQGNVKMKRVRFMSLCGQPIPGRILSDEDVKSLCAGNYNKISKELYKIIGTSFGYSEKADLQGTVEDGQALINELIENGSSEVKTQAKLLYAELIAQIAGQQEEAIKLFDEGIKEMEAQNVDVNKILESEKEKVAAYIYNDDLEGADAAAKELLEKYSRNDKANVLWDNVLELYWLRIMGWKDENPEHARELCKEGLEINNGYAIKKGDPWEFKSEYERLIQKASIMNKEVAH